MDTENQILETLDLERFFAETDKNFDLNEGTVENVCANRVVYLPEDAIRGIHGALLEETGEAWKIVFKNCGILWGRRVAKQIDRELGMVFSTDRENLRVAEFIRLMEQYFAAHGWGQLELDLSAAMSAGYIHVRLRNSVFVAALDKVDDHVDAMIAGILKSFFETVSGSELDAIEIACERNGAPCCEFLISAQERIEALETDIAGGSDTKEIIAKLEGSAAA